MAYADRVQSETVAVQNKIAIANSAAIQQGEEKDRTEKEMNNFRSHVEIHKQEFQKASKDMPIGENTFDHLFTAAFIRAKEFRLERTRTRCRWEIHQRDAQRTRNGKCHAAMESVQRIQTTIR